MANAAVAAQVTNEKDRPRLPRMRAAPVRDRLQMDRVHNVLTGEEVNMSRAGNPRIVTLAILILAGVCSRTPGQPPAVPATGLLPPSAWGPVKYLEDPYGDGSRPAAAVTMTAASPSSESGSAQDQQKAARQEKLRSLQFDRRPATILAQWLAVEAEKHRPAGSPPPTADQNGTQQNGAQQNGTEPTESARAEPKSAEEMAAEAAAQAFDKSLQQFQRDVTLGNWPAVASFIKELGADDGKTVYLQLLTSLREASSEMPGPALAQAPRPATIAAIMRQRSSAQGAAMQRHVVTFDDLLGLSRAAPCPLDEELVGHLGTILQQTLAEGNTIETFLGMLRSEMAAEKPVLDRRQAALLLMAANEPIRAGEFLPTLQEAETQKDHQALNLLSRRFLAQYQQEQKPECLNQAWLVTQAVFAAGVVDDKQRAEALMRAVELAPQVKAELGQAWLDASFTAEPQRGMEIIAAIGAAAANGLGEHLDNAEPRLKLMRLQKTATEALLVAAPEKADQWAPMLDLLGMNWLRESALTIQLDQSTARGPAMQRDRYGNLFYIDDEMLEMQNQAMRGEVAPITTADMLATKPNDSWLQRVRPSLRTKFDMVSAQLHLKVNEEEKAFPYIERLAQEYPRMAQELADSFLNTWTNNHDPNADRNRTSYYMFMYGYEQKAESIPLTRSKQERNLRELAGWVKRLKALPIERVDEKLLSRAFMTCHSSAEVYKLEAIQEVFGEIDQLDPKTLAELAQQMRANLMGVWRQPATQENSKTKRKPQDIQAEVLRGYSVAREVVEKALAKHADDWRLQLALAALDHDENNYQAELSRSTQFTSNRQLAFERFAKAATLYAQQLPEMAEPDQTTQVYELWFYACLGACDLQHVREDSVTDTHQPPRIREAILALPEPLAKHHLAMFANTLFTRMSAVNPAAKFRYLEHGFAIVGDHAQALEARKVFDYYNDLVTEIKLDVAVDGSDRIGHQQPFGVFVNIRHTRDIERESGGFGRYLQNQNSNQSFSYNYGRPTENYRDKFEAVVKQALGEHFEVLSVTFESDSVTSKAMADYGWRVTPYAYLLLKARGPEVDTIPPVRLDLDFLDTSGYVILPIESPALPVDAGANPTEPRPVRNLVLTQTLDERQAEQGRLLLEIKATAQGLVPPLTDLVQIAPGPFDVTQMDDQGLLVSRFDAESDDTVVISERTAVISFQAKKDLAALPTEFAFPEPKAATKEVLYQRYVDADLLAVDRVVALENRYGSPRRRWVYWIIGAALASLVAAAGVVLLRRRKPTASSQRFTVPDPVTPFSVIGLLRQIESENGLDDDGRRELAASIRGIEEGYFAQHDTNEPDLHEMANRWVRRAREERGESRE